VGINYILDEGLYDNLIGEGRYEVNNSGRLCASAIAAAGAQFLTYPMYCTMTDFMFY
jgi:hypothetical protein